MKTNRETCSPSLSMKTSPRRHRYDAWCPRLTGQVAPRDDPSPAKSPAGPSNASKTPSVITPPPCSTFSTTSPMAKKTSPKARTTTSSYGIPPALEIPARVTQSY
jgi:hypothetical protein